MSITVAQFAAKLEALGQGKALAALLRKELIATGLKAQADTQTTIRERLAMRTGTLVKSPAFSIDAGEVFPQLTVRVGGRAGGKELRYTALQEFGGTVRPVKGRFLAIPVGPALTGAGVPRYATARDVPGLTFIRTDGGAVLAKVKKGRGKNAPPQIEVWFSLRRSVTIGGRHFTRDGVRPAFAGFNVRIADAIARAINPGSPTTPTGGA